MVTSEEVVIYQDMLISRGEFPQQQGAYHLIWQGSVRSIDEEEWIVDGEKHREDGPAIIIYRSNCDLPIDYQAWVIHGKYHRLGGPAREWPLYGCEEWWFNGKKHRIDGPADEGPSNKKEWWIEDKRMTYNQWRKERKVWLAKQRTQEIKDLVI
jgi:hypothetical protein